MVWLKQMTQKYHCDHHKNILCAHIQEVLWYILNANQHWFPSGRELFLHCFLYGLRHSVMLHLTTLQSVMSTQLIKNTCLIALLECGLKKFRFIIGVPIKVIYIAISLTSTLIWRVEVKLGIFAMWSTDRMSVNSITENQALTMTTKFLSWDMFKS